MDRTAANNNYSNSQELIFFTGSRQALMIKYSKTKGLSAHIGRIQVLRTHLMCTLFKEMFIIGSSSADILVLILFKFGST